MSIIIHYVPYHVRGLEENRAGVACGKYYKDFRATHHPDHATCKRCRNTQVFWQAAKQLEDGDNAE